MKPFHRPIHLPLAILAMLGLSPHATAQVRPFVDDSGILRGWAWEGADGVSLHQVQRLPDQTRGFFQGRGFPAEAANRLATACVLQTILRNEGGAPIEVDLADWRISVGDAAPQPLKLTADWQAEWEGMGVAKPARIAFQWAMFPNRQTFQPKDWNMGMIGYPLRPGDRFDLHAQWRQGGEVRTATLPGLECAPDVAAETLPVLP
jgi:hypothetical protein